MSLLDDVSIVVTPNGYKAGELYAVIPVPTEGAEEVVNGDFATDSNWSKNTGWTISGGTANKDSVDINYLTQDFSGNGQFKITYTISSYVSGDVRLRVGTGFSTSVRTSNGTYTEYITKDSASFGFYGGGEFSIDNVSVKELTSADMDVTRATAATRVDENGLVNYAEVIGGEEVTCGDFSCADPNAVWGTGGEWVISGGVASTVGTTKGPLTQGCLINGLNRLTFTLVSGEVSVYTEYPSFGVRNSYTIAGTYTIDLSNETNPTLYFYNKNAGTPASISNVSVKEVDRDNVPRIDYTGGGCPHILAEPQRTNTITYSSDFSEWTIDGNSSITPNAITSPDGTLNATKLIAGLSSGRQAIKLNNASTGDLAVSIFAKKGEYSVIQLTDARSSTAFINFDLEDGLVGSSAVMSGEIVSLGNDWYRCSATYNSTTDILALRMSIAESSTSTRLQNFSGNGSDGLYIWGCQVEVGSYPTSLIPTNGEAGGVTRNQDIFTRDGIGSLINSTEGVLFVEMAALSDDSTNRQLTLSDGSDTNRIVLKYDNQSNIIQSFNRVSGVETASLSATVSDITQFSKIAIKYKLNDYAMWIDGVEVDTDNSSTTFPSSTLNKLSFGTSSSLFGKVKQLQVYDTSLSDTQLAALTS